MSELILPENVTDATEQYRAEQDVALAVAFERELKKYDPRLSLIWVKENSTVFPRSPRWCIVRRNEKTVDSYWLIETEDDEYSEPTPKHFERLISIDTWGPNHAFRDNLKKDRERKEAAALYRKEEKRREFREKLNERLGHVYDTQVSVPNPEAREARKDRLSDPHA